jgi:methyl-accepting chemotaxis protein
MAEMEQIKDRSIVEVKKGISGVGRETIVTLAMSMGVIAIIFIFISLFIVRTITRPSTIMLGMLREMAKGGGDLTKRIVISSTDEIGDLAKWFNLFVEQLRNMIARIFKNTEQVSNAAEQFSATAEEANASMVEITNGIQDISKGASLQLTKVREVEKVFKALTENLNLISNNASNATSSTVKSAQQAEKGRDAGNQLIANMDKIVEAANLSSSAIQELKESSKEIGDIIVTITSFADQTNLLSLNAAIEAARAGEAGRGFAVVAEEVRKLAEGSSNAAHRISQLIQKIISEIDKAVGSVVKGTEQAEDGKKIVESTSKFQETILNVANQAKELMLKISELVPQQLKDAEGVMTGVKDVASVAEQNAATTEEFSSSIEQMTASMEEMTSGATELAKTATELRELTAQFKIE